MTNPEERIVQHGYENCAPRSSEDFANAWRISDEAKALRHRISRFDLTHPLTEDAPATDPEMAYGRNRLALR
jgi:ATP-binding cassette, subfamily G (WHITE), member 2, PDR